MHDVLGLDLQPVIDSASILWRGFILSMGIAAAAIVLAVILGVIVALARLSPIAPLRWLAFAYTQIFRGIALYVLIIWVYFGLAVALNVNIDKIAAGILVLALLNSGYLSETFRAGILAVDRGQTEAAKAIGLSRSATFRHVVAPQALRIVTPAAGNQFVDAIKDSSILLVIGVPELMYETQRMAQQYTAPFEFYSAAAVLYVAAVAVISWGFRKLERKLDTDHVGRKRLFGPLRPVSSPGAGLG